MGDKTRPSLLPQRYDPAIHAASALVRPSITKTKRATLVLCYIQAGGLSVERPVTPVARGQKGNCTLTASSRWPVVSLSFKGGFLGLVFPGFFSILPL